MLLKLIKLCELMGVGAALRPWPRTRSLPLHVTVALVTMPLVTMPLAKDPSAAAACDRATLTSSVRDATRGVWEWPLQVLHLPTAHHFCTVI